MSYANAFCLPVDPKEKAGLEAGSADRLKQEAESLATMYGLDARKRWLLAKRQGMDILQVPSTASLQDLLDQLEAEIRRG